MMSLKGVDPPDLDRLADYRKTEQRAGAVKPARTGAREWVFHPMRLFRNGVPRFGGK
jgi:hypothetical protein